MVVVGAWVVDGTLVVVGAGVAAVVATGAGVVDGAASPSLPEHAASSIIAAATASTPPFRAIDGWYFVPTVPQWATARWDRNAGPETT
jgi:hypothetical protein